MDSRTPSSKTSLPSTQRPGGPNPHGSASQGSQSQSPRPPGASGSASVRHYADPEQEVIDLAASPSAPRSVETGLLTRAKSLSESPTLQEVGEASRAGLAWSVLPLIPPHWERFSLDAKALAAMDLYHPDSAYLGHIVMQEWWPRFLHQAPVWLVQIPAFLHGQPPLPVLVQSKVVPSPGDSLELASIASCWDADEASETFLPGTTVPCVPPRPEVSLKVMWPALRLNDADTEAAFLGAIKDRAAFRVLPESKMAFGKHEPWESVASVEAPE